MQEYNASSIQALNDLQHVRLRPSLYIGSIQNANHLFFEICDNSVDEFLQNACTQIDAFIYKDYSIKIKDNGRGIPVGITKDKQGNDINSLTLICNELNSGGKYNNNAYQYSAGLHGMGIAIVNFLSEWFTVTVYRDGNIYQQSFIKGKPSTDVQVIGKCDNETGTEVFFKPDAEIFKQTLISSNEIRTRLIELAVLNSGLTINFNNELTKTNETFFYKNGITNYINEIVKNKKLLFSSPIYIKDSEKVDNKDVLCELTFIYDDEVESSTSIRSFVNNINTYMGGTHLSGLRNTIKDVCNEYGIKNKLIKDPLEIKYYLDGFYGVISLKLQNPSFEGQTKTKLNNPEAEIAVTNIIKRYFSTNSKNENIKKALESVILRAVQLKEAEIAARKAKIEKRAAAKVSKLALPPQLSDCVNAGTGKYAEIFLAEGSSAHGCVNANTLIHLADNRDVPIKQLVLEHAEGKKNYVFCCDVNGNIHVRPILNAFRTQFAEKLYRITLDNEQFFECTANHLIMMRNGTYTPADQLQINDNIMPLYRKDGESIAQGYIKTYNYKVIKIEIVDHNDYVYDLEIEEYHNFAISAGIFIHNSIKSARDPVIMAALPLRGKVLNTEKASFEQFIKSSAIQNIITTLGTGFGKSFDINKLRYDKIITACFKGDTRVKMLDGTIKTFEELVELEKQNPDQEYWVYSCKPDGTIVPGKMRHPRITQYVQDTMKMALDDGGIIETTLDHRFMLRDGTYCEAQNLKIGDSLMPLYTRNNTKWSAGREELYDNNTNSWKRTHRIVIEYFDNDNHSGHEWHAHHINRNFLDNRPDNLEWQSMHDHMKEHNDHIIAYNQSQEHRDRVKQLHQDGVYQHTYWGNNGYNGSEAQKTMLQELNQREDMKQIHSETLKAYNVSEQNRETTRKLNRREDVKLLQKQGKIIHSIACLIRENITFNEQSFQDKVQINIFKEHLINVPTLAKINEVFESFDDMLQKVIQYEKNELTDEMFKQLTNVDEIKQARIAANFNTKRGSIAKLGKMMLDQNLPFNADSYQIVKKQTKSKSPVWDKILDYFKSMDEFQECSKNYNHKVVKIEHIHYDESIPMYCGTVEDYHNFVVVTSISENSCSGVVVRNCDADVDGSHIMALIVTFFYNYMRPLITQGYLYATVPPLYKVIYKNKSKYLLDDKALNQWRNQHKNDTYEVQRFKGLGEMDPDELWQTILDPTNRVLKQITITDVEKAEQALSMCMGSDVAPRRQFIEDNAYKVILQN